MLLYCGLWVSCDMCRCCCSLQGLLRSTQCLCMSSSNLNIKYRLLILILPSLLILTTLLSSYSHPSPLFLFSSLPSLLILIPPSLLIQLSLGSLLILIPPLSYSDPSILFLFSSSHSDPSILFLFSALSSLLILIPPLSSFSYPSPPF